MSVDTLKVDAFTDDAASAETRDAIACCRAAGSNDARRAVAPDSGALDALSHDTGLVDASTINGVEKLGFLREFGAVEADEYDLIRIERRAST